MRSTMIRLIALTMGMASCRAGGDGAEPVRIGEPPVPVRGEFARFGGGVNFSPDGRRLWTRGAAGVQAWDTATVKPLGKLVDADVQDFVRDGSELFVLKAPIGHLRIESVAYVSAVTGAPASPIFHIPGDLSDAASSANGRYFARRYHKGTDDPTTEIDVVERSTSRIPLSIVVTFPHAVNDVRLNRDGSFLLYDDPSMPYLFDSSMHVVRVRDSKLVLADQLVHAESWGVDFSPDGKSIVIGGDTGFKIFDLTSEKLIGASPTFPLDPSRPDKFREVRFSGDGTLVLFWSRGILRRWSVAAGAFTLPVYKTSDRLEDRSMSRDGRRMFSTYYARNGAPTIEGYAVIDFDSGRTIWKWSPQSRWDLPNVTAISPDGRYIAVNEPDSHGVLLFDLNDLPASPVAQPATAPAAK